MGVLKTLFAILVFFFVIDKVLPFNPLREINPIRTNKYWTYIEESSDDDVVPDYLTMCLDKMKRKLPDLVVLTPNNIHLYLDDFPIKMDCMSPICLKERVNLLFAFILDKYGGVCISPGVIVMPKIYNFMYQTYNNDIVTIGKRNDYSKYKTSMIGAKKNTRVIKKYKENLLKSYLRNNETELTDVFLEGTIKSIEDPCHFHFNNKRDGSENTNGKLIDYKEYLGETIPQNSNILDTICISIPFERLLTDNKIKWITDMSKEDIESSDLLINKLLKI